MAQPPLAKRQKLTALAEKYGHPTKDSDILSVFHEIAPYKSGLTPLDPGPFANVEDRTTFRVLEDYQRERFSGFTAAELHAAESIAALSPIDLPLDSLRLANQPIHPLFQRQKWNDGDITGLRHKAKFPLKGDGKDIRSNPVVWHAMEPALRLASLFLENAGSWPWWDAFVNAPNEPIDLKKEGVDAKYHSQTHIRLRLRDPIDSNNSQSRLAVHEMFKNAGELIDYGLGSGRTNIYNGQPYYDDDSFHYGITDRDFWNRGNSRRVVVILAFEMLESLLNPNSTTAERSLDTFRFASVLLHETAHACWGVSSRRRASRLTYEPYFENEAINELGFSLENALFGGLSTPMINPEDPETRDRSVGGIFSQTWDTIFKADYHDEIMPVFYPKQHVNNDYWYIETAPIPVSFFLQLHDPKFWTLYIKQFGGKATHVGPKILIVREEYFEPGKTKARHRVAVANPIGNTDGRGREIWGYAARIQQALIDQTTRGDQIEVQQNPDNPARSRFFTPAIKYQTPTPSSPRFNEIRDYLFANRQQLALDTMDFPMPVNTLYHYIVTNGGIVLDPDEWDSFCRYCGLVNDLFDYSPLGLGVLRRLDQTWPQTPVPLRTQPGFYYRRIVASEDLMTLFKALIRAIDGNRRQIFADDFLDHDSEDMRAWCNDLISRDEALWVKMGLFRGGVVNTFSRRLFEACLWSCDREGSVLTYGPEGIVRKIPPRGRRIIKRDNPGIIDTCRPM